MRVVRPWAPFIPGHFLRQIPVVGRVGISLPNGHRVILRTDGYDYVTSSLFWHGLTGYEPATINLFLRLLRQADVFIDIGANTGLYALIAAAENCGRQVYAFEPVPRIFQALERNIRSNDFRNCQPHCLAVGDYDGEVRLFIPPGMIPSGATTNSTPPAHKSPPEAIAVPQVKLDTFISSRGIGRVDLIKIDTETTEPRVLRGALSTLEKCRPFVSFRFSKWAISFLSRRLIANSRATAASMAGGRWSRCEVVYNALDAERFSFSPSARERYRGLFRLPGDSPLIGFFGGFSERKGVAAYLETARIISRKDPRTRFLLAGAYRPSHRASVENAIRTSGLEDLFIVTGHSDDMPGLLSAVDAVCLPSVVEPFGRLILESWAVGKPIVATRSGGPEEIITPGRDGLLVDVNAPGQMAEALLAILADGPRARALVQEGRATLERRFGEKGYVERMAGILEETMSCAHLRGPAARPVGRR